jgi:hypothetical protein
MNKKPLIGPHGIDLRAPGGIEALFAFNRSLFGDAVMEAGAGDGGSGGDGGTGTGAGDGGQGAGSGSGDGGTGGDGDEPLGEPGKKALLAEREAVKNLKGELTAKDQRIAELENAGKSQEDKEKDRVAQLEKSDREKDTTITSQAATILRYQVAAAKGLDLEAAERLRGASKEEIEADADAWIKKWGGSRDAKEVPGAGAGDSGKANDSAPGLPRMRNAYASSDK